MPEKTTLHFKDGSSTAMDAVDARRVLREHSEEWATAPFPASVQRAAQEDAEALHLHLARLRADGKTELEVEKARHAWATAPKTHSKDLQPGAEPVAPFEAKDKGAGWWAIFDANGAVVGGNIRKPEAEAFNAKSDEDKAEHVKAEIAAS